MITRIFVSRRERLRRGFSLLEFLVMLVIGGVLIALAAPSFRSIQREYQLSTAADLILTHLHIARSHAVTHSVRVEVCSLGDGDQCGGTDNWSDGWMIFEDSNRNRLRDDGEMLLLRHRSDRSRVLIRFRKTEPYQYYHPTGLGWPGGTFTLCPSTANGEGRAVVLAPNGRPRMHGANDARVNCEPSS